MTGGDRRAERYDREVASREVALRAPASRELASRELVSREPASGETTSREPASKEPAPRGLAPREPASARPAALTGVLDHPQDVKAARPVPADPGAAQERQAPVTARSVIDQIVQRAQLRLGRSEAEMVIDLKPDALWKVHLRITAESGRVVAEIRAENAVTRQLIETGLPDLRTALADRGLDLRAIAVSGGFGSDVAWNGARSRGSEGDAGHGQARASPGGAGMGGVRHVGPSVAGGPSTMGVHLVDCVA
ncbi:MAG: flagellar hook-length control protein FliK [Anaerolineae bacterium]|nr:flagellar hook-length control protein FliK [Anaerolineae bacterium]